MQRESSRAKNSFDKHALMGCFSVCIAAAMSAAAVLAERGGGVLEGVTKSLHEPAWLSTAAGQRGLHNGNLTQDISTKLAHLMKSLELQARRQFQQHFIWVL